MKIHPAFVLALGLPAVLAAQEPPTPSAATDSALAAQEAELLEAAATPPPGLASAETARSRRCVPVIARMAALDRELEPLGLRAQRIQALGQAVSVEDPSRVTPLDASDPLEAEVQAWFEADQAMAQRLVEQPDSAVSVERQQTRERMLQRLRDALQALEVEINERLDATGDLGVVSQECEDVVFIRSAVLEACATSESPICEAARASEPTPAFRFVEAPEDLWDIESLRPWSNPARMGITPEGGVGGGRTAALVRRGNVVLVVGLEPVIRERANMPEDEAARVRASLDSLGFEADHPDYLVQPALSIQLATTEPLGGETHYILHFGDLSAPADQVVWSTAAPASGPVEALTPATKSTLDRLAAGEELSLTAVRLVEDSPEADAVYSLMVPFVGQPGAVSTVVSYMSSGQLVQDLAALMGGSPGVGR